MLLPLLLVAFQTDESSSHIASPDAIARIDGYLQRLAGFDYGGSILIERSGEVVLRAAYGYADRPAGRRHSPEALFEIGSLAKQFTAAAVLELERRDRLSLEDSLAKHLPGAPPDKAGITIAQLLTHTAGLPADVPSDAAQPGSEVVDRETVLARILAQPLEAPPGSAWSYSNCGYVLLAAIVERAGGGSFHDLLREFFFEPAGMTHTGFWGSAPADRPAALGHDGFGNVLEDPTKRPASWYDMGGGQIWSTLDDMRTWIHALGNGTVLDAESVGRMLEPHASGSSRDGSYGYGWSLQETSRGTLQVHHGGDTIGCGAWLRWFLEDEVLLITSTNVRHDVYPTQNVVQSVLPAMIFDGAEAPPVPAFETLDAPPPPGLEGAYALADGSRLVLRRIHGRLYVGAEGQGATDVLAAAPAAVERERAWCSQAGLAAIEGALRGETQALTAILGSNPNPRFAGILVAELAQRSAELGGARTTVLLGTFATGWPHGNPPSTETTLMRIHCERGDFVEAIRWDKRVISWTEEVSIPLACCVPLQRAADGAWVGWKLLEGQPLSLRVSEAEHGRSAIEVDVGGRKTHATRL